MIYLLTHLIETAAERDPVRIALRHRGEAITYGELVGRVARLAHALVGSGVKVGDRVGIMADKGIDAAVALYGAMAAGAAYVPVDPRSPIERRRFVIEDCDIRHLVVDERRSPDLDRLAAADVELDFVVGIDDATPYRTIGWDEISSIGDITLPETAVTEQDLCYILYTSGSTGVPKGIMHTHRSALAWAEVSADTYGLRPDDVISNYAPLHFDLSTLDYFGGARAGSTTVIIPEEHTRLPASLAHLLAEERLTLFYTVPLALVRLAQPGLIDTLDLPHLRRILFGGEPMPMKHLRALMGQLPHVQFVNVYGPTETNGCTHFPVPRPLDPELEALPIGFPYRNVEALVLDEDRLPVSDGEVGELVVRAPTVMKGYWGRSDLNERAFHFRDRSSGLPDVFHPTGDLVSRTGSGDLKFYGRKDRQIKARGSRVELDEVEAVMLRHPGVSEAAVFANPDDDGVNRIFAAVVSAPARDLVPSELEAYLAELLPPYAIPESIRVLPDLPRTSSGKIDRVTLSRETLEPV